MPKGFYDRQPIKSRLLNKIKIVKDCWIWTGAKLRSGYGTISLRNKTYTTHRISYLIFRGALERSLEVCHKCNNKSCIRPDHLYLATRKKNAEDASRDNLLLKGEKCSISKLSLKKIDSIRKLYRKNKRGFGCYKLAQDFAVHPSTIYRVVKNRTWKNV